MRERERGGRQERGTVANSLFKCAHARALPPPLFCVFTFSTICRAANKVASFPHRPTARPPANSIRVTSPLFTRPPKTISTTSIVSASVTRRPPLKTASMPNRASQVLISGPPP